MEELNWKEEVAYTFEVGGRLFKREFIVNGIDGKRYIKPVQNERVAPTTHDSTGDEFKEMTAELVASRISHDDQYRIEIELIYRLPDTGKYIGADYVEFKRAEPDFYFDFLPVKF